MIPGSVGEAGASTLVVDAALAAVASSVTGAAASPGRATPPSGGLSAKAQQELADLTDNAFGRRPLLDEEGMHALSNELADEAGRYISRLCRKR